MLGGLAQGHGTGWPKPEDLLSHTSGHLPQPLALPLQGWGWLGGEVLGEQEVIKGAKPPLEGTRCRLLRRCLLCQRNAAGLHKVHPHVQSGARKQFRGTAPALPGGESRETMRHVIWEVLTDCSDGELRRQ